MALTLNEQQRLSSLQLARDQLISGRAVATFEFNGQRTEYSRADLTRLEGQIDRLEAAARLPTGHAHRRGGAITFRL